MTTRKKRDERSDIGPVWLVSTEHDQEHVAARDAVEAVEVFLGTAEQRDTARDAVIEVKQVAKKVFAGAAKNPGDGDHDGHDGSHDGDS